SVANTSFTLEFFANAVCDPSGFGEGQSFLGQTSVTTNSQGNVDFSRTVSAVPAGQRFLTATATDPAGNTSEFSKCVTVHGAGTTASVSPLRRNTSDSVIFDVAMTRKTQSGNSAPFDGGRKTGTESNRARDRAVAWQAVVDAAIAAISQPRALQHR